MHQIAAKYIYLLPLNFAWIYTCLSTDKILRFKSSLNSYNFAITFYQTLAKFQCNFTDIENVEKLCSRLVGQV